ncbi:methyltransferase domain-containing protein [candidate division GN15 bacterium]|nr:methyltransferase domain-containing protein [candidate division GN15 bacterium]
MPEQLYRRFATVYDRMGADRFSAEMAEYTIRIVRKFDITVTDALDLCCGTGTALQIFHRRGWRLAGIDQSPEMLAVAGRKLARARIDLYRRELPSFSIPLPGDDDIGRGFDLVTSFYDSLNYMLTKRALTGAFRSVYKHLKPGGWFVFDMNTAEALKTLWAGQVYADVLDDLAWVWKNRYDEKKRTADCAATFFVRKGSHWERFTEVHTERAYPNSEIKAMLRAAGFMVRGFYRCFSFEPPTRHAYRICAVAQRPVRSRRGR